MTLYGDNTPEQNAEIDRIMAMAGKIWRAPAPAQEQDRTKLLLDRLRESAAFIGGIRRGRT